MYFSKEKLKELEREARDRQFARSQVHIAVKKGVLVREPCICGNTKVEGHHDDYTKPLDVIWVCRKHHIELDRMKRNQELEKRTGIIL